MLTGSTIVYQCPKCGQLVLGQSILSVNDIKAKYYSDGRMEGPYFCEQNSITECPACKKIFWLDLKHQVDEFHEDYDRGDPQIANHYHSLGDWAPRLDIQGWRRAINEKVFGNAKEELFLQTRLLWELNKYFLKHGEWESSQQLKLWEDTIQDLLLIIQPQRPQEYLLKAELQRNLGQFEQALESLDKITDQDYLAKAYQLHQRIIAQDRWVFRFQVPSWLWFLDSE